MVISHIVLRFFLVFWLGRLVLRFFFLVFGFLVEQHLTAKRWEGFGTALDSKEMGRFWGNT